MDWSTALPWSWLALAILGLALSFTSLSESILDWRVTKPSNGFRALALGDIISESIRVVIYVAYGSLSVFYIMAGVKLQRPFGAAILVGALFLLVVKSFVQIAVRRYVRHTHGRRIDPTIPMTQNQIEDRDFGEERRALETQHTEDRNNA